MPSGVVCTRTRGKLRTEVVDEYTIAMRDPQQGRLVFEARIGVMK